MYAEKNEMRRRRPHEMTCGGPQSVIKYVSSGRVAMFGFDCAMLKGVSVRYKNEKEEWKRTPFAL